MTAPTPLTAERVAEIRQDHQRAMTYLCQVNLPPGQMLSDIADLLQQVEFLEGLVRKLVSVAKRSQELRKEAGHIAYYPAPGCQCGDCRELRAALASACAAGLGGEEEDGEWPRLR